MARHIEIARIVDAPADHAWSVLVDTALWPAWGPSIRTVECVDRCLRADTRGRIRTAVGLWLTFEVTRFEEGRVWSWRVAGVPATGHRVEPLDAGRCRVVFEVPRWGWLYTPVCRRALHRIAQLLAVGRGSAPCA